MDLAGSPGPHVFVESLDAPQLDPDDLHHIERVLRVRTGDPLTISDGTGRWCTADYSVGGRPEPTSDVVSVDAPVAATTVAFSLVKGQKPELVVQKLTELGIDRIVALDAERSVVRWDDTKIDSQRRRWTRIAREAAMQSHRVRLPELELLVPAREWIGRGDVAIAHFGGTAIDASVRSVAIGPEGGWSPEEVALAETRCVSLGATVLRAETAAIAAATLLSATASQ